MSRLLFSGVLVLAAACGSQPVTIRLMVPDERGVEHAIAGARVFVLPFNRDSILDELVAAAPSPRPHTRTLDSLFQQFQSAYQRYTDALIAAEPREVAGAARAMDAVRRDVGPIIDSLRADVRAWERVALAGYDSIAASHVRGRIRQSMVETTDANGLVTVGLSTSRWWIHARAVHAGDPNAEWYWNLPASGDTIRLDATTGQIRPRY